MKSEFSNPNSRPSYALMSTISGHGEGMLVVGLRYLVCSFDAPFLQLCLNRLPPMQGCRGPTGTDGPDRGLHYFLLDREA